MNNRTDILVQKVRNELKDPGGHRVNPSIILSELDAIQLEVAQRGLAIKDETDLTLEKGTDLYDLGGGNGTIFRLKGFVRPPSWNDPLEIVNDVRKWDELVSSRNATNHRLTSVGLIPPTSRQCTHAMIWNGRLRLFPAPAKTGDQFRVYFYRLPSANLEEGRDPEVDRLWDNALLWGALGKMVGDPWASKYEFELERLKQQEMNESGRPLTVEHFTDNVGF
jgi:hypothetical protein